MAEESFQEKTEKPTPRKKQDVREKGEVAKSKEVPSVAVLLVALISLTLFGSYMYHHLQSLMKGAFSLQNIHNMSVLQFMTFSQDIITRFLLVLAPLLAAIFITAVLSNVMQVGFILSGELIKPKLSKLNPIKGFGRLFSKQSFMELFKSLMKLAIIGAISYITIKGEMKNISTLGEMAPTSIFYYILITIFKIFIRCTLAMILLVVVDYAFQKWEFEKRIMMTKQEIKDELKKTEGDPLVKSRIKSIQMQMARKRMMQEVPKADVVITNPTHLAVALKYESAVMKAPKLVAKGAGSIAQRIREVAEKNGVPVLENKDLARSLYTMVDTGQEIPSVLYQSVAEVLAYVYKLKNRWAPNRA